MHRRSLLSSLGALGPAVAWSHSASAADPWGQAASAVGDGVLTIGSLAALRHVDPRPLAAGAVALVSGGQAPLDGGGGVYVWDPAALAPDDGHSALAAAARAGGRWLRFIDASRLLVGEWRALAASNGAREGTLADVVGDPGVHFDPAVGRTVANAGTYRFAAGEWRREGDLKAPYAAPAVAGDGGRSLRDYLPADRREATLTGNDRTTDHAPYLQAMLDDGVESIDLGNGTYNLRSPLRPRRNVRLRGRDGATVLRSTINGYIFEASANNQRLGLEQVSIEADPALGRAGGFRLYDPATFNAERVRFRGFARSALRFVQGVSVAVIDSTFVNCGMAAGEAAIYFDPGKTATVVPVVERCYVAGCATGLKADLARALRVNATIFETCRLATDFSRVDGLMTNCWFEANTVDGRWTDSSGMQRVKVISTNPDGGRWQIGWSGSAASDRGTQVSEGAFAEMRSASPRRAGAAGRWADVAFDRAGAHYRAVPMPGGAATIMQAGPAGVHAIEFRAVFTNTGSRPATGSLRALVAEGGEFREVAGSYVVHTVAPGTSATLAGSALVQLAANARVKLQWSVDDPVLGLACPTGGAAPAEATCAVLAIRHRDVILS